MNILCGVLTPDAGRILFKGEPLKLVRRSRRSAYGLPWCSSTHARSEPDGGGKLWFRPRRLAESVEPDEGGRGGHRRAQPSLRPRRPAGRSRARPLVGERGRRNLEDFYRVDSSFSTSSGGRCPSRILTVCSSWSAARPDGRPVIFISPRLDEVMRVQRARQRDADGKVVFTTPTADTIRASSRERWSDERSDGAPGAARRRGASFSRREPAIARDDLGLPAVEGVPSRCAPGERRHCRCFRKRTERSAFALTVSHSRDGSIGLNGKEIPASRPTRSNQSPMSDIQRFAIFAASCCRCR